eukprot:11193360-Lingulodinium_polyedra.AAC.2
MCRHHPCTQVLFVDFTPAVGCNALAVHQMQLSTSNGTPFYYTGFHTDKKEYTYCSARITNEVVKGWLAGTWSHPSIRPEKDCPPLPTDIIKSIPGGEAAMGATGSLNWKICVQMGGTLSISEQHLQ